MSDINPPRAYDLSQPDEFKRLMRETWGYLHTCRTTKCGGDFEGRAFAMDALETLKAGPPIPESAQGARVPEGRIKRAIEALTQNQQQMDEDGIIVGVSREAIDVVVKAFLATAPPAPSASSDADMRVFGASEAALDHITALTQERDDTLLQDVLRAVKQREAYAGELSYLERQLNEILIRTPVPARSPES